MVKKIPSKDVTDMTDEELNDIDKLPPPEEHKDFQDKVNKSYKKDAEHEPLDPSNPKVKVVGNLNSPAGMGNKGTLKRFAKKQVDKSKPFPITESENIVDEQSNSIVTVKTVVGKAVWVKVTKEEHDKLDAEGRIMGYSPEDSMALVRQ
jgi:hypothetical protein